MSSEWNDKRPMAPHLQIWRWHPAMLSSILHRITTVISYVFMIKLAFGLLFFKSTGHVPLEGLLYSPLGWIGFFVGFFALIFTAFAQLRHLIWDRGNYLEPAANNTMSWVMIALSVIGAAGCTYMALGA